MRIIKTILPGILLALTLSGCNSTSSPTAKTGFLSGTPGATPVSYDYIGERPPIQIQYAEDRMVLIYNHGTARPQTQEDCDIPGNQVPPSLLQQESEQVLIFYLCSEVVERSHEQTGEYIYKRLAEVELVVDELIGAGVPPHHIFLSGHSAGGWTSLMAASYFQDKFNGAVVFAPAFAGPRHEEEQYPRWRREALPRQIEDMLRAYERHALIFAYYDDPFERPQELEFLVNTYAHTIQMIAYECANTNGHLTHMSDCREEDTASSINEFITDRARAD